MDTRWSIYIDIEGFGALYEKDNAVLRALGDLMDGIYLIGTTCYTEMSSRIFAHQTGDGFAIVSEFGAESLETPVAIAIALLRHVASSGRFAKAAIAEGAFADITGCYPKRVRDSQDKCGRVIMNGGFMTLFPVMGPALINAFQLSKVSPSGALLALAAANSARLPDGCVVHTITERELIAIDWVHSSLPLVAKLQQKAGLRSPDVSALKSGFHAYFHASGVKEEWKANTAWYLSLGVLTDHA